MMKIECGELSVDEQLALAAAISDKFEGRVLALVKDEEIVLDVLIGNPPRGSEIEDVVRQFVSRRKDAKFYSVEQDGEFLIIHSADPLARSRGRKPGQLPENVLKCPLCAFVTPYEELFNVHVRAHYGLLH